MSGVTYFGRLPHEWTDERENLYNGSRDLMPLVSYESADQDQIKIQSASQAWSVRGLAACGIVCENSIVMLWQRMEFF